MKVGILFSRPKILDYENKRLIEEAKNFDNIKFFYYDSLTFPNFEIDLDLDLYYIFNIDVFFSIDHYYLAKKLKENGKIVINKNIDMYRIFDKTEIYYNLIKNGIKIPKTMKFYDFSDKIIEKIEKEFNFPLIIKHSNVHRGRFVKLIRDEKDLLLFISRYRRIISYLIFQEYIKYEKDLRIIFVGEPIGVMQRINPNDYRANISRGGYGKADILDEELKEISYKLSEIFNMQIFSFDVLVKDNEYFVIDVHRKFQFQGFEKYTGINVAKKILEYLNGYRD